MSELSRPSIDHTLFDCCDSEFATDCDVSEAVRRLSAHVVPHLSQTLFHDGLVGVVEPARVNIYHHNPWYRTRGMRFIGAFSDSGGRAMLRGHFGVGWWGPLFWVFFGLFLLVAWLTLVSGLASGDIGDALAFAVVGLVIWALYYTSIRVTARGDIDRITRAIGNALKTG